MRERKRLIRTIVAMASISVLAGALGSTPGIALTKQEKKQVKKIARKQATKVFNSLVTGGNDGTGGGLQQACEDGSVRAFANVQGAGGFSSSYVDVDGYNCTGGSVEAKRTGLGIYRVRFGGLDVGSTTTDLAVVGSASGSPGTIFSYGFASESPEDVLVANTMNHAGDAVDTIFTISVLRP